MEARPGAVIHTDVSVMYVLSLGGAKYLMTFINEGPGHVRALHMKTEGRASELLRWQATWIQRKSGCMKKRNG